MDADVISFGPPVAMVLDAVHDANFETESPARASTTSTLPRIPSGQEIEDRIYEILKKMDVEKVWINPDCGLRMATPETWPSLENLVAAAQAVRQADRQISRHGNKQADFQGSHAFANLRSGGVPPSAPP